MKGQLNIIHGCFLSNQVHIDRQRAALFRFASNKYSNDSKSVGDVYMHLTNYSINKNSSTYTQNDDSNAATVNIILIEVFFSSRNC